MRITTPWPCVVGYQTRGFTHSPKTEELHLPSAHCILCRLVLFERFAHVYNPFWSLLLPFLSTPSAPPHLFQSLTQSPNLVLFCDPLWPLHWTCSIGAWLSHRWAQNWKFHSPWMLIVGHSSAAGVGAEPLLSVPRRWWAYSSAGPAQASAACYFILAVTVPCLGGLHFGFPPSVLWLLHSFLPFFFNSPWAVATMFRVELLSANYSQCAM